MGWWEKYKELTEENNKFKKIIEDNSKDHSDLMGEMDKKLSWGLENRVFKQKNKQTNKQTSAKKVFVWHPAQQGLTEV